MSSFPRVAFIISSLLGLLLCIDIGLSDQEAYYWLWSKKLALCYLEHPGLQAWITNLFSHFLGDSTFAVRFPGSLLGRLLGFWFLHKWLLLRYSDSVAHVSALSFLGSFFLIASSLISLPDAFLFPFFSLLLYDTEKKNFYRASVWLGLCALCKWTAVFFIPGFFWAYWVSSRSYSTTARYTTLLKLGVISGLLQLPTLIWNFQNNWASFRFHLVDRHPSFDWNLERSIVNLLGFGFSQVLLSGFPLIILLGFLVFSFKRPAVFTPKPERSSPSMPLTPWILPAFLIVGMSALRGELRFYWTAPALILIQAAIVDRIFKFAENPSRLRKKLSWALNGSLFCSYFLVLFVLYTPVGEYFRPLIEAKRTYDLRFSPRGDVEGWREIVSFLKDKDLDPSSDKFFLVGSNFRLSAQIAWATGIQNVGKVHASVPSLHQLHFWTQERENFKASEALFFADNRYRDISSFNNFCLSDLSWNEFTYVLGGKTIKIIKWAHCPNFNRDFRY